MNDSEMIFSIVIWLVIIASLIYLLIRKIIKEENFNNEFKTGDITEKLEVKCKKDFLKIEILQKEGKKPMSSEEFLNGNKIKDSQFF